MVVVVGGGGGGGGSNLTPPKQRTHTSNRKVKELLVGYGLLDEGNAPCNFFKRLPL